MPGAGGVTASGSLACADAVETALLSLGAGAGRVTRVDVRSRQCDDASCPAADPAAAFVTAVTPGSEPVEIEVRQQADGSIVVASTAPGKPPELPPFSPPAPAAPPLEGAPAGVTDRQPLPFCGSEEAAPGGPYDSASRTCFLDGVLAESPVEFITRSSSTEGTEVIELWRYDGAGGVEVVTAESGTWILIATGIRPAGEGRVFVGAGMSSARTELQ
jgi:hypothetical protein